MAIKSPKQESGIDNELTPLLDSEFADWAKMNLVEQKYTYLTSEIAIKQANEVKPTI